MKNSLIKIYIVVFASMFSFLASKVNAQVAVNGIDGYTESIVRNKILKCLKQLKSAQPRLDTSARFIKMEKDHWERNDFCMVGNCNNGVGLILKKDFFGGIYQFEGSFENSKESNGVYTYGQNFLRSVVFEGDVLRKSFYDGIVIRDESGFLTLSTPVSYEDLMFFYAATKIYFPCSCLVPTWNRIVTAVYSSTNFSASDDCNGCGIVPTIKTESYTNEARTKGWVNFSKDNLFIRVYERKFEKSSEVFIDKSFILHSGETLPEHFIDYVTFDSRYNHWGKDNSIFDSLITPAKALRYSLDVNKLPPYRAFVGQFKASNSEVSWCKSNFPDTTKLTKRVAPNIYIVQPYSSGYTSFSINAGETIRILASGSMKVKSSGAQYGPEGLLHEDESFAKAEMGRPYGGLMMSFGVDSYEDCCHYVGKELIYTAKRSGYVSFFTNDLTPYLSSGQFKVQIISINK